MGVGVQPPQRRPRSLHVREEVSFRTAPHSTFPSFAPRESARVADRLGLRDKPTPAAARGRSGLGPACLLLTGFLRKPSMVAATGRLCTMIQGSTGSVQKEW